MPADIASTIMLRLLNGFDLRFNGVRINLGWSSQRLLAFLAFQDRPVGREYVAGSIWPETTTSKANANLRTALWRTHRACDAVIETSARRLALAANVAADAVRASATARRLLDAADPCDGLLTEGTLAELSSALLPDWCDSDWVIVERERYRHLRLHALEAMCIRLVRAARYTEAVEAGQAAVAADPLRESAQHALITAHLAAGNRAAAIRQYETCRRLLLTEVGLEPSPALQQLRARAADPA